MKNEWIVVLPKHVQSKEYELDVNIKLEKKVYSSNIIVPADKREAEFEWEGYTYKIALESPALCKTIYIDTDKDDSLMHYIHQDKIHTTHGLVYAMNDAGVYLSAYGDEFGGRENTSWEEEKRVTI